MRLSARKRITPGRKRLGTEVFKFVSMWVEPTELEKLDTISKETGRSHSDVMHDLFNEMGLAQ